MKKFKEIQKRAQKRKGGPKALKELLPVDISKRKLAQKGDDRFLAMMAKAINQAGFKWSVVAKKWPEIEEAFHRFDIAKLSKLNPRQWDDYSADKRIIRNPQKIRAVYDNLHFVRDVAKEHGSFSKFIAYWPQEDQFGLQDYLKKFGSRLGGSTAQWFLRYVGKDCFVLSHDVVLTLQDAGLDIADEPKNQRDRAKIQDAFNQWHKETKLSYSHLSKIAAYSVGINYENKMVKGEMAKFA